MSFEYERKEYQDNLENIKKVGSYQDYENAVYELNILKNKIIKEYNNMIYIGDMRYINGVATVIDQVDNLYYGDIIFHTSSLLFEDSQISHAANVICDILNNFGEDCHDYSLYYNRAVQGFMYTKVVIQADDGPSLYDQNTERFIIR